MRRWFRDVGFIVVPMAIFVVIFLGLMIRNDRRREDERRRDADEALNGPCRDQSWLLATTVGSPDAARCPNRLHRMRVQVATRPSNEEAAALVFCECVRSGDVEKRDGGDE